MITESKGSAEPAADYLTAEGRAKNRRTEISIKMQ
jgi:outer membrane protein OmpA-like peptidoglycan-associated protein